MLKEAIEKLISLAEPVYHDYDDGRTYCSHQPFSLQKPLVEPIRVQTLTGLRDLYRLHEQEHLPVMIHIQNFATVSMVSKTVDEWLRRATFVEAQLPNDIKFPFGQWLDPEQFIIGLMTLFEDADYAHSDNRKIVRLVNNLAAEAVTTSTDDGFSQQVVTKQGMVTKNEEKVSPRVSLQPFRTFREVSQPYSDFILRLRSRQGQIPSVALFEADAGNWRIDAIRIIREYFEKELPGADIVA